MIFFLNKFLDLGGECNISQEESTVLLIISVFVLILIAKIGKYVLLKFVFKIEIHSELNNR